MKRTKLHYVLLLITIFCKQFGVMASNNGSTATSSNNQQYELLKRKSSSYDKSSFIVHGTYAYVKGVNENAFGIGLGFTKPVSEMMQIYGGGEYFFPINKQGETTVVSTPFTSNNYINTSRNINFNMFRFNMNGNYYFLHEVNDNFSMYAIAGFSVLVALSTTTYIENNLSSQSTSTSDDAMVGMYGKLGVGSSFKTGPVFPFVNIKYNLLLGEPDDKSYEYNIPSLVTVLGGIRIQF